MKSLYAMIAATTLVAGMPALAADNDPYASTNKTPPGVNPSPQTDTKSTGSSSGASTGTTGTSSGTATELPNDADSKKQDAGSSPDGSPPK